MSLLTDQERIDLMQTTGVNTGSYEIAIARAIEQAVLRKLATVSVKPCAWEVQRAMAEPHLSYSKTKDALSNEPLYQAKALAAARVQALEDAAKRMEGPDNNYGAVIRALIVGKDV